jgi:Flp pilus assembly protein TadG
VQRNDGGERGQSLVEMAVLLPFLMAIVMGTVDVGRAFYAYTTLASAAYQGANCAAEGNQMCPAGAAAAVNTAIGGTLPGGVTTSVTGSGNPSWTVTVTYNFQAVSTVILGKRTFPVKASATVAPR